MPRWALALALPPLARRRPPLELPGLLAARSGLLVLALDTEADVAVAAESLRLRRVRPPATLLLVLALALAPPPLPPPLGERPPPAAVALLPPPAGDDVLLALPARRRAATRAPRSADPWREDRLLSDSSCCEAVSFGDAPRDEEAGLLLRRLAGAGAGAGDRPEHPGDAPPAAPPVGLFVTSAGETEDTPFLGEEEGKAYGLVRRVDIGGGGAPRPLSGEAPFTGVVGAPPAFLERRGVPPELAPLVIAAPPRPALAGPLAGDGEEDASFDPGCELERRRLPRLPDGVVNPLPPPLDPPSPCIDEPGASAGPGKAPGNNTLNAGFVWFRPVREEGGVPCSPPPPPPTAPARALLFGVPLPPPLLRASDDPLPDNSPPDPRLSCGCGLLGEALASSAAKAATPGRRRRRAAPSRFARA